MKPERMLEAMTDLDEQIIADAHEASTRRTTPVRGRRLISLVAAIAVLMTVSVTAFAAEDISGWFRSFFAKNVEEDLTQEQIEYIAENEQTIADSQTQDGYTLELKSAITDGTIAYISLHVTAPEDVILSKTTIEGYDPQAPILSAGNWGNNFLTDSKGEYRFGGCGMSTLEDNDGLDNTQDLLITVTPDFDTNGAYPFHSGMVWNLHFEDLIARYTNAEYMAEIQEKYPSDRDNSDVVDEAALWPEVTLAEGIWDFTITFGDSDFRELEVLTKPVTAQAFVGSYGDVGSDSFENIYEDVKITSFVLRTLSASIYSDNDLAFSFTGYDYTRGEDHTVHVVMKDGTRIDLEGGSNRNMQYLIAESPIVLDEVDYIEFSDGTKLPVS